MSRKKILDLGLVGGLKMIGSLLPKFRGRAPINWAIVHGANETGMTLHRMVKQADAGNIVDQEGTAIGPRETAEEVFRKVMPLARKVLARQIDALLAGKAKETPQNDAESTYFSGR